MLWWWVIFFLSVHKITGQRENLRASAGICGIFLEVVIGRKSNSMKSAYLNRLLETSSSPSATLSKQTPLRKPTSYFQAFNWSKDKIKYI